MTRQPALLPIGLIAALLSVSATKAEDTAPAKTPETQTSPSTTPAAPKPVVSNIVMGTVEKVTATSITLKVTTQVLSPGKTVPAHMVPAHLSPAHGWFGHMVPEHWTQPHMAPAHAGHPVVRNVTHSVTYDIGETPPVKVGAASAATRVTGSFADVKPGETVKVGLGPTKETTPEGKTHTRTLVNGIDVLTAVPADKTEKSPKK